jgi:hypothetical protein
MSKHFYRIDFHQGGKERMLCGSSPLDPAQLVSELESAAFIRLDDLFFRDKEERFRPWSEWDQHMASFAYIRTGSIVSVMPFAADPRDAGSPQKRDR